MDPIDPLKVVRNTATLEAYRQHQRALRGAAQPWLTIALAAVVLQIGLLFYELLRHDVRNLSLLSNLLMFAFGLSFCVAAIRAWLYRRSHPLELPEARSSTLRWR
jgi:predicted lysophospholipase L1 biosynthesis ABC-type transport system permease subunit